MTDQQDLRALADRIDGIAHSLNTSMLDESIAQLREAAAQLGRVDERRCHCCGESFECCRDTYRGTISSAAPGGDVEQMAHFERWVSKRWGCSTEKWADSGKYQYHMTRDWWQCWQAALSAPKQVGAVVDESTLEGMAERLLVEARDLDGTGGRVGDPCLHDVLIRAAAMLTASPQAAPVPVEGEAYPMGSDREVLQYLMQQFDRETWECERCGHSEDTASMDSADYLRKYLATHPVTPQPEQPAIEVKGIVATIIRGVCESEPADPNRQDAVCITVQDLEDILCAHLGVIND